MVGKGQKKKRREVQRKWKKESGNEEGEGVTANGVGLAEGRRECGERERVGRRQAASDSSTTGRGSLNDSLFLHDFNS